MPRLTRPQKELSQWPAWFYSLDGESAIFHKAEDVPLNWYRDPPEKLSLDKPKSGVLLDREYYIKELEARDIKVDPRWPILHMQQLIAGF